MTRNLKALGLALVAVFALGAVVASAASAQQGKFTTDGPGVTLDLTETGAAGSNAFTFFGIKTECPGSTYVGHEVGSTTNPVPNNATEVTITPTFKNCKSVVGGSTFPDTITMNNCDFVFHIGATNGAGAFAITADIVCPAGKDIEIETFAGASHLVKLCTKTIKPQSGLAGATVSTTNPGASDDLDITGTFTNIIASESGTGCATMETHEGKWDIDVTAKGTNASGEATGVTVSD